MESARHNQRLSSKQLIDLLQLEPLPIEGGYYYRNYYSQEEISSQSLPERFSGPRRFSSCIYYMLTKDSFSAFHSLLSDEIYHFYMGDPVELVEIHPNDDCTKTILGQDLMKGQSLQHVVKAGVWQASYLIPGGEYALLGCTVSPAFEFEDFIKGDWEAMLRKHPKHHQIIMRLTNK